jgi:hypothetical protein
MTFGTYYWHGADLGALAQARAELTEPTSAAARDKVFRTLLRSAVPAAIGTALDHYQYAEAASRYGGENPFASYAPEVLDRARELLRQDALGAGEGGAAVAGANHASALGAMMNLAEPIDADLIARALETPTPEVREAGLLAAGRALELSDAPEPRLIQVLADTVLDDTLPSRDRVEALHVLGSAPVPEVIELALRALRTGDLALQAEAALILAERDLDAYRAAIAAVVATWPADVPWSATEIRNLLG